MDEHDLFRDEPVHFSGGASRGSGCLLKVIGLLIVGALLVALFLPAVRSAREAARRNSCVCHFKQIGLALHNYHDVYGEFPPACTVDADGKPLHSWRTLILPYMEETQLYESIDLSKPWDDPVNQKAAQTPMSAYRCPSANYAENETTYFAIVTPNSCLRPGQSLSFSEIPDGSSRTIIITEVPLDQAVPWMSPHDADEAMIFAINEDSKLAHAGGVFMVGVADGAVRAFTADMPIDTRRALITADGGEPVNLPE